MNVFYDRKNDVVSIYLDSEEAALRTAEISKSKGPQERKIDDMEEAADLLLNMVDIVDKRGNLVGFRVFNASKHYDMNLLDAADPEELSSEELRMRPDEKVLGIFKKGK